MSRAERSVPPPAALVTINVIVFPSNETGSSAAAVDAPNSRTRNKIFSSFILGSLVFDPLSRYLEHRPRRERLAMQGPLSRCYKWTEIADITARTYRSPAGVVKRGGDNDHRGVDMIR